MPLEIQARAPLRSSRNKATAPHAVPGRGWYGSCRFVADLALAAALLAVTAPVIALAAALVRLTTRGPAFFSQVRLGRGGRPFRIYKLRSMFHDCERFSGPRWSFGRDNRITPVGRVLRYTHVDELPQLWNVLRGDMSLIGPRPERPEFVPQLAEALPRYRDRLLVLPGMTGLAQVQLPADSDIDGVRRKLAYDLYYISAMSPWLDLRILLSTALKIVGVPFTALRALFAMPSGDEVEAAYRDGGLQDHSALHQLQPA